MIEAEHLLLREYGRLADRYDRYSVTTHPAVWKEVRKLLPEVRGRCALDLACGTGSHTVRLARAVGPNGSVVGIDAAHGMVKYARHRPESRRRRNLKFLLMDSRELKFKVRSFDVVLSTFGFAFFGRRRCLREVFRVLKESGVFLCVGWHGVNRESKAFVEALGELRAQSPSPPDVRRLLRARRSLGQHPENRPRKDRPTLVSELRRVGFQQVRQIVKRVAVRFRDPTAYVRYKMTSGEYERELRRLSPREKRRFVEDVARRLRWSPGRKGGKVTWKLAFVTARKA